MSALYPLRAAYGDRPLDNVVAGRYIEALEAELEARSHSAVLTDPADTERTTDTEQAHAFAAEALRAGDFRTAPVQLVWHPASGLCLILECRGQRSATGHGKQGLHPERGALLEAAQEAGLPVRLAFLDRTSWQQAWLEELPDAVPISLANGAGRRFGWRVDDFPDRGDLILPKEYAPRRRAEMRLGEGS